MRGCRGRGEVDLARLGQAVNLPRVNASRCAVTRRHERERREPLRERASGYDRFASSRLAPYATPGLLTFDRPEIDSMLLAGRRAGTMGGRGLRCGLIVIALIAAGAAFSARANGASLVRNIAPGVRSSHPDQFTKAAGTTFFGARDPSHGYELWRT